ncbi:MAG: Hint domain-containing protein [Roseovarius sp.]|uniref:Hint domain-containing protein n=1 Tax=Roseovarius sp. TaxID=1486281 RepID=UPI0032EBA01E
MAGERFLLSGDQIATYGSWNASYPGGLTTIKLHQLKPLGDADDRYFLVRTQGDGDVVTNGQFFAVYEAVDDGNGNLVPGPTPIISPTFATPDAYNNTGAGDDYIIFGMFGGSKFAVDLGGFEPGNTASFRQGEDVLPGGDGELNIGTIQQANPDASAICFARGTLIRTPSGDVPVETLAVGALVCVPGGPPRPIRWIARRTIPLGHANRHLAPVRIARDAFGPGLPSRDLLVSPNHRLMHRSPWAQLWFESASVLLPAKFMVNGRTVRHETAARRVEYWHFLLDSHEVVWSNGVLSESLHPGDVALTGMAAATRAELLEVFPELAGHGTHLPQTCLPSLRRYEADLLLRSGDLQLAGGEG